MRIRYLRALKGYEEVGCWPSFLLTCHMTLNKLVYLFLGFLPCKVSGWTLRSFQFFSLSPMTLCPEGQLVSQVNYSIGQRSCLWCWTSVRWTPGSCLVVNRSWLFSALLGSGGLRRPLSGVGRPACSWRETPESLGVQRALEEESGEGPSLILIFAQWVFYEVMPSLWTFVFSSVRLRWGLRWSLTPDGSRSLPGLWGRGQPIKIQPFPICPKAQASLVGLRMRNKAHSLVRNVCSFIWKKRQSLSRCSIYIFSSDNWTLRMIGACYASKL